jgi:hypothetical protein
MVGAIVYLIGPAGAGTAMLTIRGPAANGTYEGTWSFVFANPAYNRQGSLTTSPPRESVVSGLRVLNVDVTLQPTTTPACEPPFNNFTPLYGLRLSLSGSRLLGESFFSDCGEYSPGRVDLTRR